MSGMHPNLGPFPHHSEMFHRVRPAMLLERAQLNELAAHCYAKWRSLHQTEPILMFLVSSNGSDGTHYVRTESENNGSLEPLPEGSHMATYVNGEATFLRVTAMTQHFDLALAGPTQPATLLVP